MPSVPKNRLAITFSRCARAPPPAPPSVLAGGAAKRRGPAFVRGALALDGLAWHGLARLRGLVPILRRPRRAPLHDVPNLLLVDGLVLDQRLGHQVQLLDVLLENGLGLVVAGVDDLANLLVDGMRRDV